MEGTVGSILYVKFLLCRLSSEQCCWEIDIDRTLAVSYGDEWNFPGVCFIGEFIAVKAVYKLKIDWATERWPFKCKFLCN